jgi:hypothetical protein
MNDDNYVRGFEQRTGTANNKTELKIGAARWRNSDIRNEEEA